MILIKCLKKGFTIVELLVGVIIFSIITIAGFKAYFSVLIGKAKLIEKTTIEKNAFYFSEKVFEMIKKGGVIDYEEYFNRKVVGNTSYLSGHYSIPTGYGNFGVGGNVGTTIYGNLYYYCISGSGSLNRVGTGGCYNSSLNNLGLSQVGPQRYGQYFLQFRDYNFDYNTDSGDHDGDGNFKGDDDDEFLGEGPTVFTGGTDVKELYLISGDRNTRTYFRWNVKQDINHPTYPASSCSFANQKNPTGSGCLGTIEFLKLEGKDWGLDHTLAGVADGDGTQFDGLVDTWLIHPDFTATSNDIAGSNSTNHWVSLFPDTINVKDFYLYLYPNKDRSIAWKNTDNEVNISPYLKLQMTLTPSWEKRKQMKGEIPEIPLNITIGLTDLFTK